MESQTSLIDRLFSGLWATGRRYSPARGAWHDEPCVEQLENRVLLAGVTLVTHGWNASGGQDWVPAMLDDVAERIGEITQTDKNHIPRATIRMFLDEDEVVAETSGFQNIAPRSTDATTGELLVFLDWTAIAGWDLKGTAEVAGAVVASIVSPGFFPQLGVPLTTFPIHLIGHSRGGSLVSELSRQLGELGIWVDQVTTLDQQPIYGVDALARVSETTVFQDNYWRTEPDDDWFDLGDVVGAGPVNHSYNRQLDEYKLDDERSYSGHDDAGYQLEHSDVHLWYNGTVKYDAGVFDGERSLYNFMRDNWYTPADNWGQYAGFSYSRIAGGSREAYPQKQGLHRNFGGTRPELAHNWNNASWSTVFALFVDGGYSYTLGDTIPFRFKYNDYDSNTTVSVWFDRDANPYNGNEYGRIASTSQLPSTGDAVSSAGIDWGSSLYIEGQFHVFAQIEDDNGHTRIVCAPEMLVLGPPDSNNGTDLAWVSSQWYDDDQPPNRYYPEPEDVGWYEVTLKNTSTSTLEEISGVLTVDDQRVGISPPSADWYSLGAGAERSQSPDWQIDLSAVNVEADLTFTIDLTYRKGAFWYTQSIVFSQHVGTPEATLAVRGWWWDEDANYHGQDHATDGLMESGETGSVEVTLQNLGDITAEDVEVWLTSDEDDHLVWANSQGSPRPYGDIDVGELTEKGLRLEIPHDWPLSWQDNSADIQVWAVWRFQSDPVLLGTFRSWVDREAWGRTVDMNGNPIQGYWDLGPRDPDELVEMRFAVENFGSTTLYCQGLLVSDPDSMTWEELTPGEAWDIRPGEDKWFEVTFDFRDGSIQGQYSSAVTVLTGNARKEDQHYDPLRIDFDAVVNQVVEPAWSGTGWGGSAASPDVSGDWAVWHSGSLEIWAWNWTDGSSPVRISAPGAAAIQPKISGTLVVWSDRRNDSSGDNYSDYDLYGYDLSDPGLGEFPVRLVDGLSSRVIGVDGDKVAFSDDYRWLDGNGAGSAAGAGNLVVFSYQGAGQFSQWFTTGWSGSNTYDVDSKGDFGEGMLVFERAKWQDLGYWDKVEQKTWVIDIGGGAGSPQEAFPGGSNYQSHANYGASDGRFVFANEDGEGDVQLFLWTAPNVVQQLTTGTSGAGGFGVLTMGGMRGSSIVAFTYESGSRPGIYYLSESRSWTESLLIVDDAQIDTGNLRADGHTLAWTPQSGSRAGQVAVTPVETPDLGVRCDEVWLSNWEPTQGQPFDVDVLVRNLSPYDAGQDVLVELYDGDLGGAFLGSGWIAAGDLTGGDSAHLLISGVQLDLVGSHNLFVYVVPLPDEPTGNNHCSVPFYVRDNDVFGPLVVDLRVQEGTGSDGDDVIGPDEQVLISWRLEDESGVDLNSVGLTVDGVPQVVVFDAQTETYSVELGPLVLGEHELVITATDLDDDTPAMTEFHDVFSIRTSDFVKESFGLEGLSGGIASWADFDRDGDLDLVVTGASASGPLTRLYRNDGGSFADIGAGMQDVQQGVVAWGDYDGDGDLDLLLGGWDGAAWITRLYRNDDGTFLDSGVALPAWRDPRAAWADYDGDGDLDLAMCGQDVDSRVSRLYRNDKGSFVEVDAGLTGVSGGVVAWADYDNDGDYDILLGGATSDGQIITVLYRNDGGVFIDSGAPLAGTLGSSAAWGDIDNDGDLDLVLGGTAAGTLVYRNDGGTLAEAQVLPGSYQGSVSLGDYDNDGDTDLLVVTESRWVGIYENQSGQFQDSWIGVRGVQFGWASWGDYDDDGDLDIVIIGQTLDGPISLVYRNTLDAPNTRPTAPGDLVATLNGSVVILGWSPGTDAETPASALTYHLRVGASRGGSEVFDGFVGVTDPSTGLRALPMDGNVLHNLAWVLSGMTAGRYFWSVHAVDGAFVGSEWAAVRSFTIFSGQDSGNSIDPISIQKIIPLPSPKPDQRLDWADGLQPSERYWLSEQSARMPISDSGVPVPGEVRIAIPERHQEEVGGRFNGRGQEIELPNWLLPGWVASYR